ncbi:general secretion pathway protein H [Sphingobium quisquiliarum P25]|uniref:Type II secretion system protein H n=1 Tax=Sphingobium quisquiliarum P25 TaxID=1329909 RepID=T0G6F3_9SPHN|nr:GspH/FimT family pseudopilin [Sphingobium quisquiliarum]EQA99305.1 general secretion pathway protein H [Sphingobium quisquiliarum P25]
MAQGRAGVERGARLWVPAFAGTRWGADERGFRLSGRSAEHGFTLSRRSAEHGFTLVELMVVLTIIGFISAAVVLAIPDPRGRVIEDADRFAARVAAARDEAVVTSRPMGVWVSASGYGFQRREGAQWVPVEDKPFVTSNWKAGTRALVGKDGRQQIGFDGTGLPTDPMKVTLAREAERVAVTVDMAGKVAVGG